MAINQGYVSGNTTDAPGFLTGGISRMEISFRIACDVFYRIRPSFIDIIGRDERTYLYEIDDPVGLQLIVPPW